MEEPDLACAASTRLVRKGEMNENIRKQSLLPQAVTASYYTEWMADHIPLDLRSPTQHGKHLSISSHEDWCDGSRPPASMITAYLANAQPRDWPVLLRLGWYGSKTPKWFLDQSDLYRSFSSSTMPTFALMMNKPLGGVNGSSHQAPSTLRKEAEKKNHWCRTNTSEC